MVEFRMLGKNPTRFVWEEDAMEASWTFAPGDPALLEKLESMVNFVRSRMGSPVPVVVHDIPAISRAAAMPELPASSVANGWEIMAPGEEE